MPYTLMTSERITAIVCGILFIIIIIATWLAQNIIKKKNKLIVQPTQLNHPTGVLIHDGNCGVGCINYYMVHIISMLISLYLVIMFLLHILSQRYSLTNISLNNAIIFVFTENQIDPVIYTNTSSSLNIMVQNINNIVNIQVNNFTTEGFGNITYIKVFLDIKANQFGLVSNIQEYSFDLAQQTGPRFYQINTTLVPINRRTNSTQPAIQLYNFDTAKYKTDTFLTNNGCFISTSTNISSTGQSSVFSASITFDSIPGGLIINTTVLLLNSVLFTLLFIYLYTIIYQCCSHQTAKLLILRQDHEIIGGHQFNVAQYQ